MTVAFALALLLSPVQDSMNWHEFKMRDIDGKERSMAEFKDKIVLVVNTASQCGLTPQYEALEALHNKYKAKGFSVVGFPCNDFGDQEPGTEAEIKQFCTTNYGVTFPMFAKVHVKGDQQAPMYQWLIDKTGGKDIEWNFGKFLIGRKGEILGRFGSRTKPDDPEVIKAIEAALGS